MDRCNVGPGTGHSMYSYDRGIWCGKCRVPISPCKFAPNLAGSCDPWKRRTNGSQISSRHQSRRRFFAATHTGEQSRQKSKMHSQIKLGRHNFVYLARGVCVPRCLARLHRPGARKNENLQFLGEPPLPNAP